MKEKRKNKRARPVGCKASHPANTHMTPTSSIQLARIFSRQAVPNLGTLFNLQQNLGNQEVQRLMVQSGCNGERFSFTIQRYAQTDDEARATFREGRAAYEAGRFDEALRLFEAASAAPGLDPSRQPGLAWNIALARARLGDYDNAMTGALTYGQLSNDPPIEQLMTLIRQIRAEAEPGAERRGPIATPQTDDEARSTFLAGRAAYEAGHFDEALRLLEATSATPGLDPSRQPYIAWNIALAKARLGDYENAMTAALTYGQYEQPSDAPPYEKLITIIRQIRAEAEAGAEGRSPGTVPQSDEEARDTFEEGRAAYEAGRFDEALRLFESASAAPGLDPSRQPGFAWNIALAKAHLGNYDDAMTMAMNYGQLSDDPPAEQLITLIRQIRAEGI